MARMGAASGNEPGWQAAQENVRPKGTWLPAVPSAGHPEGSGPPRGEAWEEGQTRSVRARLGSGGTQIPGPSQGLSQQLGHAWASLRGCPLGSGVPVWIHPEANPNPGQDTL